MVERKRCIWHEKEAEYINKLVKEKEIKKIWEAIRNITGREVTTVYVEPCEWISYFQGLFFPQTMTGRWQIYARREH
jgi:hypothetical protein